MRQYFVQTPPPGTYIASLRDGGQLASGPREYVVRSGDSLAMVASRFDVSTSSIRSANSLKSDELKIGQVLKIPGTSLASQQ